MTPSNKPSALRLGFGFVVFVGVAFLVAWLASLILSCTLPARRGWYAVACILSPVIGVGFIALTEPFI